MVRNLSKRLTEQQAVQVFLDAGLEPLEPFRGARFKWKCQCMKCGHRYAPQYSSVNAGHGCPKCARDYQAQRQRVAGETTARETCTSAGFDLIGPYLKAKKSVTVKCQNCSNEMTATLNSIKQGSVKCVCRKEARKKLSEFRPDLFEEIDWEENPDLLPNQVGTGMRRIISWKCKTKGHKFKTSPASRVAGKGECWVCSGLSPEKGVNDFATKHPVLAMQFISDPKDGLTPSDVFSGSSRKFLWQCPKKESHKYSNSPWGRVKGEGCPYCANKKVLQGDNDLESQFPELMKEWDFSKNLHINPSQVTPGSAKKAHWVCKQMHEWEAVIASRTQGVGCEKCFWFEPGRNDLGTLGSDLLRAEWDEEVNRISISEVSASDPKKYSWKCEGCHEEFRASPVNRHFNNTGCPSCASTGYSQNKPSTLYFLKNEKLGARKLGKTNTYTAHDRIGRFEKRGWATIYRWERESGESIDFAEKAGLSWIREEMSLPQFLTKSDMRGMAGETETFSIDGPSDKQVIDRIEEIFLLWQEGA